MADKSPQQILKDNQARHYGQKQSLDSANANRNPMVRPTSLRGGNASFNPAGPWNQNSGSQQPFYNNQSSRMNNAPFVPYPQGQLRNAAPKAAPALAPTFKAVNQVNSRALQQGRAEQGQAKDDQAKDDQAKQQTDYHAASNKILNSLTGLGF
ncbi:MAG: hypothetical protein M1820_006807 [Bogoriella megaspora]|nr:MAG: hypothetical protein M1820_006807 [Bogoriella megaspora]